MAALAAIRTTYKDVFPLCRALVVAIVVLDKASSGTSYICTCRRENMSNKTADLRANICALTQCYFITVLFSVAMRHFAPYNYLQ
jgi:hypothetical protein